MQKQQSEILAIQLRFFEALDIVIETGQCGGLKTFCDKHNLNRVRYSYVRTNIRNTGEDRMIKYKIIDLVALTYLCQDYNVSADWLLLGKGKMFNK